MEELGVNVWQAECSLNEESGILCSEGLRVDAKVWPRHGIITVRIHSVFAIHLGLTDLGGFDVTEDRLKIQPELSAFALNSSLQRRLHFNEEDLSSLFEEQPGSSLNEGLVHREVDAPHEGEHDARNRRVVGCFDEEEISDGIYHFVESICSVTEEGGYGVSGQMVVEEAIPRAGSEGVPDSCLSGGRGSEDDDEVRHATYLTPNGGTQWPDVSAEERGANEGPLERRSVAPTRSLWP